MARYLAGVDVGTTGARCMVFDTSGTSVAGKYCEYGTHCPKPGWVEQDSEVLIRRTMDACREAIAESGIEPGEIGSVGFSTQRSVTCPVGKQGEPIRPMISWQDARTGAEVEEMGRLITADEYYALSGLPLGTTWVITKILWMRNQEPALYEQTHKFVQNQDLILKAFGADEFHTDISDMAFYGTWDVKRVCWSRKLLDLFGVSEDLFGKPTPPGTQIGTISQAIAEKTGFAAGTPLCVGAGDQNCGVLGMGAIESGIGTVTLGTAGLAILCVDTPVPGFGGMMVTNHVLPETWEVEGLSNAAAGSYRWFRDVIGTAEIRKARETGGSAYELLNALAESAPAGSNGLLYLPYLATAATPRWNPDARSAFIGLSLAHGRGELTRAVMEGVVLEIRDMIEQWLKQGMPVDSLRIGGGATRSQLWNQIQADVYGRPVQLLRETESTVLGAAILGGVGAGIFGSIQEGVDAMVKVVGQVDPIPANHDLYSAMYDAYVKAYQGLDENGAFSALAQIQARE